MLVGDAPLGKDDPLSRAREAVCTRILGCFVVGGEGYRATAPLRSKTRFLQKDALQTYEDRICSRGTTHARHWKQAAHQGAGTDYPRG